MNKIKGIITALITPFKKNKNIDYISLYNLLRYQINNNIKKFVILGTTGESTSLTITEKIKMLSFIRKKFKNIKIISGSCYNSISNTIYLNNRIKKYSNYILQIVPYYLKPNQKGIYLYIKKICLYTNTPIIIYNVEYRTGIVLKRKTLLKLSKINNIIGIKYSCLNIKKITHIIAFIKKENRKFLFFCGDDKYIINILKKSDGAISILSNYNPGIINKIYSCIKQKRNINSIKLLNKQIKILSLEINPVIIKYICYLKKIISNYMVRLPLISINKRNKVIINNLKGR